MWLYRIVSHIPSDFTIQNRSPKPLWEILDVSPEYTFSEPTVEWQEWRRNRRSRNKEKARDACDWWNR